VTDEQGDEYMDNICEQKARMTPRVVVIHNHPIHYKNLLFGALEKGGLNLEVIFSAATSGRRISADAQPIGYQYSFASRAPYEDLPKREVATAVWSALNRIDPDVLIVGGYDSIAAWTAWGWAQKKTRPTILWFESNQFDYPRWYLREAPKKLFLSRCYGAHVYGETNAEYLRALGMPASRIVTKRAVIDVRALGTHPHPKPEGESRTLLYLGRFAREKNLAFLMKAFSAVVSRRSSITARLLVVGYGPEEMPLRKLAASLPCSDRIEILPAVRQGEAGEVYRRADLFVLPSIIEPWGLVALEAMCCGVAVATSTQCGVTRDVYSPDVGWSFSPYEQASLEVVLEQALLLPRIKLFQMGELASTRAREFTAEKSAGIVLAQITKAYLSAGRSGSFHLMGTEGR
jgi:glycosyltransferase involved in cell wall biosynthesis